MSDYTSRRITDGYPIGRDVTYAPGDDPDKAFSLWVNMLPERYHSLYTHDPEFHQWVRIAQWAWVEWQGNHTKDQPTGDAS